MNIVVLDDWDRAFADSPQRPELEQLGELTVYTDRAENDAETIRRLEPAKVAILIRERTWLDRLMLEQLPNLEFIAQTGGGAAHIDHDAREELEIGIAYTPGSSRQSVVELTIGLAIAGLREISSHDSAMHDGEWPQRMGRTLRGKTLSIIGFGKIGSALVPPAQMFGMNVVGWGRENSRTRASDLGVEFTGDLTDAFSRGDVVSINLGLSNSTRGLITAEALNALKPGSMLINTSRGAVIDDSALVARLKRGDVQAALDVFHEEPLPGDHPLRSLDNVILTPHIGWITDDNYENVVTMCLENIREFLGLESQFSLDAG
jgi:D-3-phosphoglycerate dehydrogenase / 2-oxoglutarate reductase